MAVAAVRSEALHEPIIVTWRDLKFEVSPPDDWMLDFAHFTERNQLTRAVEAMLGPEQYELFRAAGPKLTDLDPLIRQVMSAAGLDLGESSASTSSSTNTRKR